ncbi:phosphatidylserine decarboxylase [Candidatus Chlorohelix sp.]|uniref:phosphatidylserine decarboxylase n=1 Tax=Candidatus Chlorohelix sp. TaxID=3139201 RepID=UPI003061DDA4
MRNVALFYFSMKYFIELIVDLSPRPRVIREGYLRIGLATLLLAMATFLHKALRKTPLRPFSTALLNSSLATLSFMLFYYRDPIREPLGSDPNYIYAPAEGRVVSVEEVLEPKFIGGKALRVTIAVGLFNVQLLRSPVSGQLRYHFIENLPASSNNYLGFVTDDSHKVMITHMWRFGKNFLPVPLGSKRVSTLRTDAGAPVKVAQKIGACGFGTGTIVELYIAADGIVQPVPVIGMKVRAGTTVLGRFTPKND